MRLYYPAMPISDTPLPRRKSPAEIKVPEGCVRVIESHHSTQFQMVLGTWPFHKICWVPIGRGRLEFDRGETGIGRDGFLVLPAGWKHRFVDEPGAPLTLVILCLSEKFIASGERSELWRRVAGRCAPGKALAARTRFHLAELVRLFRRALREQDRRAPGWETALQSTADELLVHFVRGHVEIRNRGAGKSGAEQAVRGALEHIDSHPHEMFQIHTMAERCGLSPRRFTDLFKRRTGETFNHYINRRRIEYACDRLRETGHILYACHESGFNDPAYFYRVFKKQTGMTPGQFLAHPALGDPCSAAHRDGTTTDARLPEGGNVREATAYWE